MIASGQAMSPDNKDHQQADPSLRSLDRDDYQRLITILEQFLARDTDNRQASVRARLSFLSSLSYLMEREFRRTLPWCSENGLAGMHHWLMEARQVHYAAVQIIEHAFHGLEINDTGAGTVISHVLDMVDQLTLVLRCNAEGGHGSTKYPLQELKQVAERIPHGPAEYIGESVKDGIYMNRQALTSNLALGYKHLKSTAGKAKRDGLERVKELVQKYRKYWQAIATGRPAHLDIRPLDMKTRRTLGVLDYLTTVWEEEVTMATVAGIDGSNWTTPISDRALELVWTSGAGPQRTADRVAWFSIEKEKRQARKIARPPADKHLLTELVDRAENGELFQKVSSVLEGAVLGLADGMPTGDVYLHRVEDANKWTFPAGIDKLPATGPGAWLARRNPGFPRTYRDRFGKCHISTKTNNGDILITRGPDPRPPEEKSQKDS